MLVGGQNPHGSGGGGDRGSKSVRAQIESLYDDVAETLDTMYQKLQDVISENPDLVPELPHTKELGIFMPEEEALVLDSSAYSLFWHKIIEYYYFLV